MRLTRLRLQNFWSFGSTPTEITFDQLTCVLGANGTGKTAILQALSRMFGVEVSRRKVKRSDFHVSAIQDPGSTVGARTLFLEADFVFPELADKGDDAKGVVSAAVPGNLAHMRLQSPDGPVSVRFRLDAEIDEYDEVTESLSYVVSTDSDGNTNEKRPVGKHERNSIQVHYLPARRDPSDHITSATNSLLGRFLKSADWTTEKSATELLSTQVTDALRGNAAIAAIGASLSEQWANVHSGRCYTAPAVSFPLNGLEGLLRQLTVNFDPSPTQEVVNFTRLSDGQLSQLYLALVLAFQEVGSKVLRGELGNAFDVHKLRPATFSLIAMEEPENSLSPHNLGRTIHTLVKSSKTADVQVVITTHAPNALKRIPPESVRFLRLTRDRRTLVKSISMPQDETAYKYVREGVQAFPELYFARLVVLGEGDSEEVVLPRFLRAHGILVDNASVSVVPLGGRHVNHFWRLLNDLEIPHITLLDLDLGRFQGGWGRLRYACNELKAYGKVAEAELPSGDVALLPPWNGASRILDNDSGWLARLEQHGVFFSTPMDLDFMLMPAYPVEYKIEPEELVDPEPSSIVAVLGKKHTDESQYTSEQRRYFEAYHQRFKVGSKPAWHIGAMSRLTDEGLIKNTPAVIARMMQAVHRTLAETAE